MIRDDGTTSVHFEVAIFWCRRFNTALLRDIVQRLKVRNRQLASQLIKEMPNAEIETRRCWKRYRGLACQTCCPSAADKSRFRNAAIANHKGATIARGDCHSTIATSDLASGGMRPTRIRPIRDAPASQSNSRNVLAEKNLICPSRQSAVKC